MSKSTIVYVIFLRDVAFQKLLKSTNVLQIFSKIEVACCFLRHGVMYNQ